MDEYLADLKMIQDRCREKNEDTLLFYTRCLLKLHHAYYKIEESVMLSYIYQIIFPALPLVEKYFLNRAKEYLDSTDAEKRLGIIADIEISIRIFSEVCETVIQSTNAADRMLIQSAPIELGLTLSPVKICAYLSSFLNSLAEVYQETPVSPDGKNREYAFSVYPSLVSRPYVDLLFDKMPERGKVGVIKVPGKDILDIRYLRMLICHEFYHIVPGAPLRKRKARAELMGKVLLYDLSEGLYEGIPFEKSQLEEDLSEENSSERRPLGDIQRERLSEFLEDKIRSEQQEPFLADKIDEADRRYYSTKTYNHYANRFIECLGDILELDVRTLYDILYEKEEPGSLENFQKRRIAAGICLDILQANAVMFLQEGIVQDVCKFHSDLFREVFSDLLYVLTLKVQPVDYCLSFRCSPQKGDEEKHFDMYARIALIFCIMRKIETDDADREGLLKCWRDWLSLDWSSVEYDSEEKVFNAGNGSNTGKMRDGFEDSEYILTFMSNVQAVIDKYDKLKNETDDVTENEPGNGDGTEQTERLSVFRNTEVWEKYMKYGSECKEAFFAFEDRRKERLNEFRTVFFVDESSNMELISKIGMREWEAS